MTGSRRLKKSRHQLRGGRNVPTGIPECSSNPLSSRRGARSRLQDGTVLRTYIFISAHSLPLRLKGQVTATQVFTGGGEIRFSGLFPLRTGIVRVREAIVRRTTNGRCGVEKSSELRWR